MRILIFIFLLTFLPSQAKGQDSPLFIIVSCSEGVMLDGKAVSPGQMVYANSEKILIPKNGYAGVITIDGYTYELKKTIRVERVSDNVQRKIQPKINWSMGTVCPNPVEEGEIIGVPENQYANILGDSILLMLKDDTKISTPYIIELKNMLDKFLMIDTLSNNWKVYNVRKLLSAEGALLISMKEKKDKGTQQYLLKSSTENSKIKLTFDLSRIPRDSPNENVFRLAIYQLNHFYYDHLFCLYQLERSHYQSQNNLLLNYIGQQKKKYQFELFDFHK
jgi:hypothetical protein